MLGEHVEADCDVFLLDLRGKGVDLESLIDSEALRETIEANRSAIRRVELEPGVPLEIEPGILHQTRGMGILDIQVESGYRSDTEKDGIYLSDYYHEEEK